MTTQEQRNKRFDEKFGEIGTYEYGDFWDRTGEVKSHLTSEVNLTIEQVERWAEGRRMPVDKPDEDVSANALAEIFGTKLEAFDYSTNSFIDDLLAFLKELKK